MTIIGDHAHIQSADPSWFSYQPSSSLEQAEARLSQVLEESESRDLTTFIEQLCWQTYTTAIRDVFAASDEEYSNARAGLHRIGFGGPRASHGRNQVFRPRRSTGSEHSRRPPPGNRGRT